MKIRLKFRTPFAVRHFVSDVVDSLGLSGKAKADKIEAFEAAIGRFVSREKYVEIDFDLLNDRAEVVRVDQAEDEV